MNKSTKNNKLFLVGTILSSVGFLLLPIPLGIAGLVLSIMLITREEVGKGVYLLVFTLLSCGIGALIGTTVAHTGLSGIETLILLLIMIVLLLINIGVYIAINNKKAIECE